MTREPPEREPPTCPECGAEEPYWNGNRAEPDSLRAEIDRLKELFALKWDATQSAETEAARAEIERLKAAIAWTREVRPGKTESGGAIVHMTWDQFNAMRALAEPKP